MTRFTPLLALLLSLPALAQASAKPNIIFILADDLGYGELSCYGQKQFQTPHIDRLAADGLRFTQAYAGATVCAPSRASLMTGLHGGHARIRGNKRVPLQPEDTTVAELLQSAGYATALFGKWGLGDPGTPGSPLKQGFDTYFGYADQTHAHNYYPAYLIKDDQPFPLPNVMPNNPAWKVGQGIATEKKVWSHDVIADHALRYIKNHTRNSQLATGNSPFFLYLPFTLPHANNEGKQLGMEVPSDAPFSDKPWPQPEKNKAAMIHRLDQTVGQVVALLKELNLDDNTLIVFTSDNGPHNEGGAKAAYFGSSGPLRGTKRDLYEGGVRVPFIARWPARIKPATTTDYVTAFWDFLPTAADLASVTDKLPNNLDGHSILPTLLGQQQKPHDHLYFEFHERGFDQAVRIGDWKAVRHGTKKPIELYNLKTDPAESNNVASAEPEIVQRAQALFSTARTDSPDFPIDEAPRQKQPLAAD